MENIKTDFNRSMKVSNLKLAVLICSIPAAVLLVFLLSTFAPSLYNWSSNATKGIINQTLVLYLLMYLIFVYLMLIKGSKITPMDLGLDKSKLRDGIILIVFLFVLLQLYGALYSYFSFGKLFMNEVMNQGSKVAGYYIATILGVALFEEVVFRGFLIPQIFVRLGSDKSKSRRMFLALVISQAIFSASHIPVRLFNGIDFGLLMISLLFVFIIGIVFAFIYLLTDNLFIAMGVHALWDASQNNAATFYSSQYAFAVVGLFAFILMYVAAVKNKNNNGSITVSRQD